jgi:hypothetical protein
MKALTVFLFAFSMMLSSCYYFEELPPTQKITYIVTGTEFDVIYRDRSGFNKYVYDRTGTFKVYVESGLGEPVFLLAKGSDDVKVHIKVKDGIDSVRKAKDLGDVGLVYIDVADPILTE